MSPSMRTRGYLPHLESACSTYFVTFRLADSLPRKVLGQLRAERQIIEKASRAHASVLADRTRALKLRQITQKAERLLDAGQGRCFMLDPRVAQVVADALGFFHGQRYRLLAWCVMPNHVHVVFSPLRGYPLQRILHSWKSFSAQRANSLLGRTGPFWQREYFDHLVRNEGSLHKIIAYVKQNPQKAGLDNWPWVQVLP